MIFYSICACYASVMLSFAKMHGLGNDCVIIDCRDARLPLSPDEVRRVADRHYGVGCDQVVCMTRPDDEPDDEGAADIALDIYNCDGGRVGACGNATRCVASLLMQERGTDRAVINTPADRLVCHAVNDDKTRITADIGVPATDWQTIPLAAEADTLNLELGWDAPGKAVVVNVGNPHAVFFVDDMDAIDIEREGAALSTNPIFPDGVNIEFASVRDDKTIRMHVYERGAGVTQACGTGACAALVAAVRRGFSERQCRVELDGGELLVHWDNCDGRLYMTGDVVYVFDGVLHKL